MTAASSLDVSSTPATTTRLLVVASIAFFALGMGTAALGPLLPDLARRTHTSIVAVGSLLVAMPVGVFGGQIVTGLWTKSFGRRNFLIAGMLLFSTGILGISTSTALAALLASGMCMGLGFGILGVTGNVLAAEASDGAGPLNLVNAMYGLGAIVSPALVSLSLTVAGTGMPALVAIPFIFLAGLLLLIFWLPQSVLALHQPTASPHAVQHGAATAFRLKLLWLIGFFVFAYVATEASIGGWLTTLLERGSGLPVAVGAIVTSWFWLVHTASRFGAAWAAKRVPTDITLQACIGLSILGAALLTGAIALQSHALAIVAVAGLGLGLGPIMPAALAMTRQKLPLDINLATVLVMGFGTFGNVAVPWLLGALIFRIGAWPASLTLVAMPALMALLLARLRRSGSTPL